MHPTFITNSRIYFDIDNDNDNGLTLEIVCCKSSGRIYLNYYFYDTDVFVYKEQYDLIINHDKVKNKKVIFNCDDDGSIYKVVFVSKNKVTLFFTDDFGRIERHIYHLINGRFVLHSLEEPALYFYKKFVKTKVDLYYIEGKQISKIDWFIERAKAI